MKINLKDFLTKTYSEILTDTLIETIVNNEDYNRDHLYSFMLYHLLLHYENTTSNKNDIVIIHNAEVISNTIYSIHLYNTFCDMNETRYKSRKDAVIAHINNEKRITCEFHNINKLNVNFDNINWVSNYDLILKSLLKVNSPNDVFTVITFADKLTELFTYEDMRFEALLEYCN